MHCKGRSAVSTVQNNLTTSNPLAGRKIPTDRLAGRKRPTDRPAGRKSPKDRQTGRKRPTDKQGGRNNLTTSNPVAVSRVLAPPPSAS